MMAVVDDALPAGFEIETVLGPADAQGDAAAPPPPQEGGGGASVRARSRRPGRSASLASSPPTSVQEARDDRYVAALDPAREQELRRRLCGAGDHAGRLLPAGRGGARHVPPRRRARRPAPGGCKIAPAA